MELIKIYTDGSCSGNPGVGGWASVFSYKEKVRSISGGELTTTSNVMELTAVVETVKRINNMTIKRLYDFEICSDSAYVVNAVTKDWLGAWQNGGWVTTKGEPVKNRALWEQLILLLQSCKKNKVNVKFTKVKGHSGNPLNELADRLAKSEVLKIKGEF